MLKHCLDAAKVVALLLIAYAVVEEPGGGAGMTRAEFARFIDDSCLPRRSDERAVAVLDDGRLQCTIFANAGHAKTPMVLSAAVMESPR